MASLATPPVVNQGYIKKIIIMIKKKNHAWMVNLFSSTHQEKAFEKVSNLVDVETKKVCNTMQQTYTFSTH